MNPKFKDPHYGRMATMRTSRSGLADVNSGNISTTIGGSKTLVIEAQRIENIGLALKIIADTLPPTSNYPAGRGYNQSVQC